MQKRKSTHAEDLCFSADRQYQRMMENIDQGIIDRNEISRAMLAINNAHNAAIKDDKGYLLK